MIENTILIWKKKKSDLKFKRKENMFCDVKYKILDLEFNAKKIYLNVGKIRSEILCKGKHIWM